MLCCVSTTVVVFFFFFFFFFKQLLLFCGLVIVFGVFSFVCVLFFFTRRVASHLRGTLRHSLHVPLSSSFFFFFGVSPFFMQNMFRCGIPLESCNLMPFIPQLLDRIPLPAQKQVTAMWLERPHVFFQLRILAYSPRKRSLKTMKE